MSFVGFGLQSCQTAPLLSNGSSNVVVGQGVFVVFQTFPQISSKGLYLRFLSSQDLKNQTEVTLSIVHCPPVTTAIVRRPGTKYPLGFSVENGIVSNCGGGGWEKSLILYFLSSALSNQSKKRQQGFLFSNWCEELRGRSNGTMNIPSAYFLNHSSILLNKALWTAKKYTISDNVVCQHILYYLRHTMPVAAKALAWIALSQFLGASIHQTLRRRCQGIVIQSWKVFCSAANMIWATLL